MTYEVKLDVFEGPIDLLLHLITKQRVDIYEVSLASIIEEYLGFVSALEEMDLETTTGFLVVAATLLELKSARLLPGRISEESHLLEERDLLLARLVECATFRAAGEFIATSLEEGAGYHGRSVKMEERFASLVPDILARTTALHLAKAAAAILYPPPPPLLDISHVTPITASVREAVLELVDRLSSATERLTFGDLCAGHTERIQVVVRFLALLELVKAGAVDVGQEDRFGDIQVSWSGGISVEDVIAETDEYGLQQALEARA
jgi:segregation and condensation protein A